MNLKTSLLLGVAMSVLCGCSQIKSTVGLESYSQPPVGRIDYAQINESSGLAKSHLYADVIWTHNDSGDSARIFAILETGESIRPDWLGDYDGLPIVNAQNIDWEELAIDERGRLLIGAFGNNGNARRDLGIYILPEPNPREVSAIRAASFLPFRYPDQWAFPPPKNQRNFDAEALFAANDSAYLLTKHRSDTNTRLYQLDLAPLSESELEAGSRELTFIAQFPIEEMVTAADATRDGQTIAVLTYESVWIFRATEGADDWLDHPVRRLRIKMGQCEGICFLDSDTLLVSNEEGDLFKVPVASIPEL